MTLYFLRKLLPLAISIIRFLYDVCVAANFEVATPSPLLSCSSIALGRLQLLVLPAYCSRTAFFYCLHTAAGFKPLYCIGIVPLRFPIASRGQLAHKPVVLFLESQQGLINLACRLHASL